MKSYLCYKSLIIICCFLVTCKVLRSLNITQRLYRWHNLQDEKPHSVMLPPPKTIPGIHSLPTWHRSQRKQALESWKLAQCLKKAEIWDCAWREEKLSSYSHEDEASAQLWNLKILLFQQEKKRERIKFKENKGNRSKRLFELMWKLNSTQPSIAVSAVNSTAFQTSTALVH